MSTELPADTLIALLAGQLADHQVVATGVASPLAIAAIALAQATHAPNLTYLCCVGSLDPVLTRWHSSSESLSYLDGRRGEVSIDALFDHARKRRIDTIFFGAAEVDAQGRTNMSAAGVLDAPAVKFPGVAGASSLRRWVKRPVLLVTKHNRRSLVPSVQVESTSDPRRRTTLITDLGVFEIGGGAPARLCSRHAWASEALIREKTGFDFETLGQLPVTPAPSARAQRFIRGFDPDDLRHTQLG